MHSEQRQLNVIFLPYMAPGHMMPMIDIARLFASHGNTKSTIITTPANASRFENTINRDKKLGRHIIFLTLALPVQEVGLPEGCENLMSAPTPETTFKLFRAIEMLQPQLENVLIESNPDCIVSDVLYPWTVDVSRKIGIPRLAFSGSCFFNSCVSHCLEIHRPHDKIESETEEFIVPGLHDKIILTRSQLQDIVKGETNFNALFKRLKYAERNSFGVLMNSFYELEPNYADFYKRNMGINKAWHIGPLSLFNRTLHDKVERGNKTCINAHSCLNWLDSKDHRSVIYICFGSLTRFTKSQINEIASALKDSNFPFIWVLGRVMKSTEDQLGEEQEEGWWLPDKFIETIEKNGKGIVIRGWAPQVLILEHQAIGGFVTHCGWNSILEGVCAGVPLITWPIFADQFYNEKLVTQVLKVGVEVGNMVWKAWATEESELINREKIMMAITRVMSDGTEGDEIRRKTKKLSELAHKAVEGGGSSYNDIKSLMMQIRLYKQS